MVQSPHIPCLVNVPVKEILEKTFKVRVALDNDARMFALGAHRIYRAKNMVALTLGTGIGGAAIVNNKLEKNPRTAGEEIGHVTIEKNGRRCACGARGCLEAYASGEAIALRHEQLGGKKASAKKIADAARKGDKTAEKIIKEARDYLAKGLSIIAEKYNPEIIVVGGGVSNIREIFSDSEVKLVKSRQNLVLLGAAMRAGSLVRTKSK
jgi:predicted NBD/HSP70 family sugar kinase